MAARIGGICVLALSVGLLCAPSAAAFKGGGRKPSQAPLITYGQQYSGELNNNKADANYNGNYEVAIWRVPPVASHDLITVNWQVLPETENSGYFPIRMIFVQGVDDFSWGEAFGNTAEDCCEGPPYEVSGSGTAQTPITVQQSNSESSYLEFYAYAGHESLSETYPYNFTVEAPRHYLGVAFNPISTNSISANATLAGGVTMADGSAAPDGLGFTLTANWREGGTATYTANTSGGGLSFPLSLPETAVGHKVTFQISRAEDSEYQPATSTKLTLQVGPPQVAVVQPPAACTKARRRVHVLARQFKRLKGHARHARPRRLRRRLLHRKHRVAHHLHRARSRAHAVCSAS